MARTTLTRSAALLLALLLLFALCACGQQPSPKAVEVTPAPTPAPLPESKIMFRGIPWGTGEDETITLIKEYFPRASIVETEKYPKNLYEKNPSKSANFSDPKGDIFTKLSSLEIETKSIKLQGIGSVAGYRVYSLYLYFIKIDGRYAFYKAAYSFADDKEITPLEQFSDLQEKMTKLYGTPEAYSYDEDGYITSTSLCAVWDAGDGSGSYLDYTLFLSGTLNGSESVWLSYGTTSVNELFENAEREKAEKEEVEKQQHIETVKQDDSGL